MSIRKALMASALVLAISAPAFAQRVDGFHRLTLEGIKQLLQR